MRSERLNGIVNGWGQIFYPAWALQQRIHDFAMAQKRVSTGGETHKKGRRTGLEHVLVYDANEKMICVMGTWRNVAQSNA